jgi:hypothetical protein
LSRGIPPIRPDGVLRLAVPEEVEGPGGGVADYVGGEAAVEGGEAGGAFIFEDAGEDSEGGA